MNKIKLGIAPLTWTNDDLPELGAENTFEQCISEMALAGYAGCEIGNKFPRDVNALKESLALRNLVICNQWFSYFFTTQDFATVKKDFLVHLDFLAALGVKVVGGAEQGNSCQGNRKVGVFSGKGEFSLEQWKKVASGLNELGKIALDKGLFLCYHHHMGTAVQTEIEVDRLLNEVDSRYVFLNYDSGHFYFSGDDPLRLAKKYQNYIKHIHLKDVRRPILEKVKKENTSFLDAVFSGVFTVPGDPDGVIDFKKIIDVFKGSYEGWMVVEAEQDPAKAPPLKYAKMAYDYIAGLLAND